MVIVGVWHGMKEVLSSDDVVGTGGTRGLMDRREWVR